MYLPKHFAEDDVAEMHAPIRANPLAAALPRPWAVTDAPADYIEKMLGAIVGIEITITRLLGKWKVSQNQPAANQASLITALEKTGDPMARLIRQRQQ
jgi:transcriptional regulator